MRVVHIFYLFFFMNVIFLLVSALWINCVSRFSDCNKRQNLWETFLLFGATCHHWNFVVTPPSPNSVFLCNIWKWQQCVVKDGIETWKLILWLQTSQASETPLSLVIVLTQMEVQRCGFVTTNQYIILLRGYAYYKHKLLVQLFRVWMNHSVFEILIKHRRLLYF